MRLILLVFVFWATFAVSGAGAADPPVAMESVQVAETVMDCMERCIRNEGDDEKDTCKMRCAKLPDAAAPQKDCGVMYKTCKKGCGTDKSCVKVCRNARKNCV